MEPIFNVRQQSEIYIGPTADILPGVLPEGRVVVVSDATIDRLYHPMLAPYDTVLIGLGESIKTLQTVESIYRLHRTGRRPVDFRAGDRGRYRDRRDGFRRRDLHARPRFRLRLDDPAGAGRRQRGRQERRECRRIQEYGGDVFAAPVRGLRTLSDREFRAGLAEVVKAAVIADAGLFARIEATTFDALRSDTDLLTDAVSASIRVKADIVERDERESGDRRKLNLGHTLAHAIEKCTNRLNHGEAVAVGTALIADASVKLGVLAAEDRDRIAGVLKKLGFDLTPPVDVKRLLKEVDKDKKNEDGMLRIVVPVGIGDCDVRRMSHDEFAALFA